MIKFVYGFLPSFIFYKDSAVPSKFDGITNTIVVCLREKCRNNEGLLQHELTHVKQFYRTLGLHMVLYTLSKKYRLFCEAEAYRKQAEYYGSESDSYNWMAESLSSKYDLDISKQEALEYLLTG